LFFGVKDASGEKGNVFDMKFFLRIALGLGSAVDDVF
jgi:hypothetical protein